MLVLSRKQDEKILMKLENGDEIELVIVRIENGKVRVGIKADDRVVILRAELAGQTPNPKIATAVT